MHALDSFMFLLVIIDPDYSSSSLLCLTAVFECEDVVICQTPNEGATKSLNLSRKDGWRAGSRSKV